VAVDHEAEHSADVAFVKVADLSVEGRSVGLFVAVIAAL
jgi:hypothetical protein